MGAKATVHKPPSDFFVCHTYTPRTNGKVIALHFTAVSLRQVLIRFCIIREWARRNSFWHCCGRHFIGFHNTYIMQGHNRGSFYRDYVTRQSARKGGGGLTFQKKVAIFLGLICFLGYFFFLYLTHLYIFFLRLQASSQMFLLILGSGDGSETALTRCAFQILDTSEL